MIINLQNPKLIDCLQPIRFPTFQSFYQLRCNHHEQSTKIDKEYTKEGIV